MTTLTDILDELVERTKADAYLSTVFVTHEDRGNPVEDIAAALAILDISRGKIGAGILWLGPTAGDNLPNVTFGPLEVKLTALVLEDPAINLAADGTTLKALTIARRLRDLFKHFPPTALASPLLCLNPCIARVESDLAPVTYEVRFSTMEADLTSITRVAMPVITNASGTITLACATSGATIYYTTSGLYPRLGQGTVYSAPFTPAAGSLVKAAAQKSGVHPSFVSYLQL